MMSTRGPLHEPQLGDKIATKSEERVSTVLSKKRKRGPSIGEKTNKFTETIKKQRTAAEEHDLDLSVGINKSFAHMDSQLLADYVAQRTRKFESDLSSVELEDRYISAATIRDTTSWDRPRNLENLPAFLERFSSNPTKLWSASKKYGAPHTIIVAGAGLRAADLARVMRKFQTKDATVAKLFAKHIKIKDAIKFLKNTRTGMAVGTPTRLNDLIDERALAVDKLERIIVDASYIDQKKRGVLEMRETLIPLTQWLNRKELKDRYGQHGKGVDLLFY